MSKEVNEMMLEGALTLTALPGHETALLTVRGKDHDLTPADLRALSDLCEQAAIVLAPAVERTDATDLELLWYQRDDYRWNAECACGATICGVAAPGCNFTYLKQAEDWHLKKAEDDRKLGNKYLPCGPKLCTIMYSNDVLAEKLMREKVGQ